MVAVQNVLERWGQIPPRRGRGGYLPRPVRSPQRERPGSVPGQEGNRVKIPHPFRRAARRRKVRQVRRKIAAARRIDVETDAMLARLPRKGTPR